MWLHSSEDHLEEGPDWDKKIVPGISGLDRPLIISGAQPTSNLCMCVQQSKPSTQYNMGLSH